MLVELYLEGNNKLGSTIPREFGNLTTLIVLELGKSILELITVLSFSR